jgi:hypothetical protein
MVEITRRDALALAATAGVATLAGTAQGAQANQAEAKSIPVFLTVEDGMTVQTKVAPQPYGAGTHADIPLKFTFVAGDKVEFKDPIQDHKITLTNAKAISYLILTAERHCRLKIQPIYSTRELNLGACCWECHGLLVCALPGFCVQCGAWTYCCPPMRDHKAPDRPKPHE